MTATLALPAPLFLTPGHETVDSSQRAGEPAVWGRITDSTRWVRLLGYTAATAHYAAGWEIGTSLDIDGQWRLSWLPDREVAEIEIRG